MKKFSWDEWYAKNKESVANRNKKNHNKKRDEYLKDKSCKWCGSIENLEFHHLDPAEKLGDPFGMGPEKMEAELNKGIVLCKKCHMSYHGKLKLGSKYKPKPIKHGTIYGYNHRGCHCDLCLQANNNRTREYRHKRQCGEIIPKQEKPLIHGTTYAYHTCFCRCDLCKKAWSDHCKEYKLRRKANMQAE